MVNSVTIDLIFFTYKIFVFINEPVDNKIVIIISLLVHIDKCFENLMKYNLFNLVHERFIKK